MEESQIAVGDIVVLNSGGPAMRVVAISDGVAVCSWERTESVIETSEFSLLAVTKTQPAAIEPMLQFFNYLHLPPAMQAVSKPFCDLAHSLVATLPRNPERTVALRKLLEAKDCAVRASIYK